MAYDRNNIFARILRNEIPSTPCYDDEYMMIIHDIQPSAPVHMLAIPKGEYQSFDDFVQQAPPERQQHFFATISTVADELGLSESGYRLVTNIGEDGGQTIPHFHMHILGGKRFSDL